MKGIPTPLVRANQWTLVLTVVTAAGLRQPLWLLLPWSAALGGLVGGPRWQPVFRLFSALFGARIGGATVEPAEAQRFNALLAWIMLTAGLLGIVVVRAPWVGWLSVTVVGAAALLGAFGHCVGCRLYVQLPAAWRRRLFGSPEGRP